MAVVVTAGSIDREEVLGYQEGDVREGFVAGAEERGARNGAGGIEGAGWRR